jgi:MGT family glycosyltransferase
MEVTVVISTGSSFDISVLEPIPRNFHICNHVPQLAVLKQASLFITHGGMNSVSEAMTCGVPMVVIPFTSDQPVNAAQVERLNLGKVLSPKSVTAKSLKAAAQAAIGNETICKAVAEMRKTVAQAPGNAGAVDIIEAYVRSL